MQKKVIIQSQGDAGKANRRDKSHYTAGEARKITRPTITKRSHCCGMIYCLDSNVYQNSPPSSQCFTPLNCYVDTYSDWYCHHTLCTTVFHIASVDTSCARWLAYIQDELFFSFYIYQWRMTQLDGDKHRTGVLFSSTPILPIDLFRNSSIVSFLLRLLKGRNSIKGQRAL